jgi:ABC-type dipeptide/oligopeptide/nickel transport system ATPase component
MSIILKGLEPAMRPNAEVRLNIKNLRLRVLGSGGSVLELVKGVDLSLHAGESLGIVGESGSGKSLTSSSVTQLNDRRIFTTEADHYEVLGRNLGQMSPRQIRELRRRDARMIFQDPMSSLNPVMKIISQMREAIPREIRGDRRTAKRKILDLLERVEIEDPEGVISKYPHELSGGMRQRIVIAMAISAKPKIIIADEPTTALDVHTQAAVLKLLDNLVQEEGSSLIFVSHDLSVVAGLTTRVMVMRKGLVVEEGPTAEILANPSHPYTLGLVKSIPRLSDSRAEKYFTMPDLDNPASAAEGIYETEKKTKQVGGARA